MAGPALAPRISGRTENCSRRSSAAGAAASSGVCSSTCAGVGQARFSSAVVSAITLPRVRANTVARDISSWERSAMSILSPARPRAGGSLSSQRAARKPAGRLRAYTIEQGDAAGRRCGYGGGFYDTYLPRTRPGIPWVALAFEAQLVDELACEPHDLAVGAVVTEARIIRTR